MRMYTPAAVTMPVTISLTTLRGAKPNSPAICGTVSNPMTAHGAIARMTTTLVSSD